MKPLAIMVGATGNIMFAVGNIYLSILRHSPNLEFDFIIYHIGMDKKDKKVFEKFNNIIIKEYCFPFDQNKLESSLLKYSEMTFAKFEMFDLLGEYETVIWIDTDIAVQGDISPLKKFGPLSYAEGSPKFKVIDNFKEPVTGFDMELTSLNSGLIVINQELPQHAHLREWCYKMTHKHAAKLRWGDQGIQMLLLQYLDCPSKTLPRRIYNAHPDSQYSVTATLVHAFGPRKFWNNSHVCAAFPEWWRTHQQWLRLGGTDISHECSCSTVLNKGLASYIQDIESQSLNNKLKNIGKTVQPPATDKLPDKDVDNLVFKGNPEINNGPFKGMKLKSLPKSDLLPIILNSYEETLHAWINTVSENKYANIITFGGKNGYYPTGFAMRGFADRVVAIFDNEEMLKLTLELAGSNSLSSNFSVLHGWTPQTLKQFGSSDSLFSATSAAKRQ